MIKNLGISGIRQKAKLQGLARYHTGKPCKYGHTVERLVSNGKCIKCKSKEDADREKLKNFGITPEQYFELFWKQNGKCAICRNAETAMHNKKLKSLAVDHCHETKKIRGLLCQRCNVGIGLLKHDPELLRIAALYCETS